MIEPITQLERIVRRTQADARVPALSVALHRADRPLWTFQVGTTGTDAPLDLDTRFRIGSVTKTFTAVLVMQCRDDGLLDLDDQVGAHIDVPAHGELTVRRLLSHTAGLQREPHGDVWDTLTPPEVDQLIADLVRAERVLPPARRYHYSNLGLALLGHAVGRLRGGTWAEVSPTTSLAHSDCRIPACCRVRARPPGSWSTRTPTMPGRSRAPTSPPSRPPRSCGARPPTWRGGPRTSPTRSEWTRPARCSRRTRSTRCVGR
jgi:hypothetical protein